MKLEGQVVCVMGGGRGIGRAAALACAAEGADVSVCARGEGEIREVCEEARGMGRRALALRCDITDRAAVEAALDATVREWGRLDVLINSAGGGGERKSVVEGDPEIWVGGVMLNLVGPYYACRAAIPHMARGGGGKIINIGSGLGHRVPPRPVNSSYAAGKAGLHRFTQALAMEVWEQGIEVNEVIPGPVHTELTREVFDPPGGKPPAQVPSERVKTAEECVPVILYLAAHPAGGPIAQTFSLARRPL
jgi:3-oxoacyl-[acyl-carrier protein] reductase